MPKSSLEKKINNNVPKAEKYLHNYIKELELHFDLTKEETCFLLNGEINLIKCKKRDAKWWDMWRDMLKLKP